MSRLLLFCLALAALPLAASAFDYLENAAAWTLLLRYPEHVSWVAGVLGGASALKQTLTWASVIVLAVGGLAALVGRVRGAQPGSSGSTQLTST